MNTKKTIIALVVAVVVSAVAYFAYKKFLPGGSTNTGSSSGGSTDYTFTKTPEEIFQEMAKIALASLSQVDKEDAYNIAGRIYDDCKGWGSHNMSMYDYLHKWSNAKFYFFVTVAYPSYDNLTLVKRLKAQNWKVLNKWSKDNNYDTEEKALKKINQIIYRVENFTF